MCVRNDGIRAHMSGLSRTYTDTHMSGSKSQGEEKTEEDSLNVT